MRVLLIGLLCFLFNSLLFGHGDLHKRIQEVTREIEANPQDGFLYFKRGKLYHQHEEYELATIDFIRSEELGYTDKFMDLVHSQSLLKLGEIESSAYYCDRTLAADSNMVNAFQQKAQIFMARAVYDTAAMFYEKVIGQSIVTFPENYLDASVAWSFADTGQVHPRAIQVLIEGIETLGNIITLQEALIALYLEDNNLESAIRIQESIAAECIRKEKPYFDLALLYEQAGKTAEQKKYLEKAQEAIRKLKPHIRKNKAMEDLSRDIRYKLKSIEERR